MDVKTCYETIGGDYAGMKGRFGTEARMSRFLKMFLRDGSFAELETSMSAGDWKTAFRAAHTLKGVCLNLCITCLANSASELTDALRDGVPTPEAPARYAKVARDYRVTMDAVSQLD